MEINLQNIELIGNYLLYRFRKQKYILAAIKGLRNGIVYGVRIRAPHALVMVFLFGSGSFLQKIRSILTLTKTHAFNLGRFVFAYKLMLGLMEKLAGEYKTWYPFIAAFTVGYFVWGENNGVNTQINLYLLSRILYGLVKLAVEKQIIREPNGPVFPWFAAIIWGTVLWMFENHSHVLQSSLQTSMKYLYHDSNVWTDIRNFILRNE
uniref:Peroxisomal membrane protein 4 n=1 Tax=Acrobeloides nanus TaxID=290746 RepID=A0A914EI78_9BILA